MDQNYKTDFVESFSWRNVGVGDILSNINGHVSQGELLAIMGPSGAGKSTLLSILADRPLPLKAKPEAKLFINGRKAGKEVIRRCSQYVEQEDSLIGSLTVRETLRFAAGLAEAGNHYDAIDKRLEDFGLLSQANNFVGTPMREGIPSGKGARKRIPDGEEERRKISPGERKRVSVAAAVVTEPGILFLDEPTSGLDSAAALKVVEFLSSFAKHYNIIVIASVHQPSTRMFDLFDRIHLMAKGTTLYFGSGRDVEKYFFGDKPCLDPSAKARFERAPADEILHHATNTDSLQAKWKDCEASKRLLNEIVTVQRYGQTHGDLRAPIKAEQVDNATILWILIRRSFIKSYRDATAYGIRVVMYIGLAALMGTIWLRLAAVQENIQAFINDIFFGGAFMSFMAVAYIPAFLEDRATYVKERANGLYGPTTFLICNFLIGIPYLLLMTVLFSLVAYWLTNFEPTAAAFFSSVMWLFFDLLAAESLVVLISSAVPIFVVALAGTAFVNGVWMCAGGFLVPVRTLASFWRYGFHYIDYQSYVFQGMMVNEFANRNYTCAVSANGACECLYKSELSELCLLPGTAVLQQYGISLNSSARNVGALIGIIAGIRVLCWLTLYLKKT